MTRNYAGMGILVIVLLLLANIGAKSPVRDTASRWEPIGLSGGGAMFTPAISPADPRRMMINCDMSGAYITSDNGLHWQMINHAQLRSDTQCRPAFHPTDPRIVYAAGGWSGLKISHDGGIHWKPIGNLPGDLRGEIAIDPAHPALMLAGADTRVFCSRDGGTQWTPCDGPEGEPLSFHFDLTSTPAGRTCFAATSHGIWHSDDGGHQWTRRTTGLPSGDILAFAGGSNAKTGVVVLYCALPSRVEGGRYVGGIYRSLDRGASWQPAMGTGINTETKAFDEWAMGPIAQYRHLATTNARPETVYACNTSTGVPPPHDATVYRSDDAGKTWRATFQADPRYPGLNVERDYVVFADGQYYQDVLDAAIDPNDPNRLVLVSDDKCYLTVNGGKTWTCGHTRLAPGTGTARVPPRWLCTGLVVTTTWNYYADPFQSNRHYICYTDIGFARSLDRGQSWQWWAPEGRAPWSNTCYELAFDPTLPGKIWGAFSSTHDIPNDNIISGRHRDDLPGGVCVSTDYAATWKKSNEGMPPAPVVSVVVDPRSSPASRTLYAGMFGPGVYKSTDDGRTWTPKNEGLGSDRNRRVVRVSLQPDGTLFALVTALRRNGTFSPDGVGLYRSGDGGEHWALVNRAQPLLWPKGFLADPRDSRIIYIAAADAQGQKQGGLYRTQDGGTTWQRLARKGPEHFGAFLDPLHPGWIYMTLCEDAPGSGLWLSRDNGATWKPIVGLPFSNIQRVAFLPSDPTHIYVTTFGGSIWRGPRDEGSAAQGK